MWTKRATLKSDDKRGTGAASNICPRVLGGRATERQGEQVKDSEGRRVPRFCSKRLRPPRQKRRSKASFQGQPCGPRRIAYCNTYAPTAQRASYAPPPCTSRTKRRETPWEQPRAAAPPPALAVRAP